MTYRNIDPWVPDYELMLMPMGQRVRYVRRNLAPSKSSGYRRTKYLTLDEFAEATGANDRFRPIGWEKKGQTPREYAADIAKLTPYPAAAFGAAGEAELLQESVGSLLRELRAESDRNRERLEAILIGLTQAGIAIPDLREEDRSAATVAPASRRRRKPR